MVTFFSASGFRNNQHRQIVRTLAAPIVRGKLREAGFVFNVDAPGSLPGIWADRDAMITALYNLLENAFKYSGDRKHIALLAYLVANEGRALTRDQILNGVWGHDIFVTQRSVDRCVTTLRNKVEADSARPRHIKTVREIGYRFEPCRRYGLTWR